MHQELTVAFDESVFTCAYQLQQRRFFLLRQSIYWLIISLALILHFVFNMLETQILATSVFLFFLALFELLHYLKPTLLVDAATREQLRNGETTRYEISAEGIQSVGPTGSSWIRWTQVERVRHFSGNLVLYLSKHDFLIFPMDSLSEVLCTLIEEKVAQGQRMKPVAGELDSRTVAGAAPQQGIDREADDAGGEDDNAVFRASLEEPLVCYQRAVKLKTWQLVRNPSIYIGLLVAMGIMYYLEKDSDPFELIFICLGLLVLLPAFFYFQYRREIKQVDEAFSHFSGGPMTFAFGEDGITRQIDGNSLILEWGLFGSLRKLDDLYLLMFKNNLSYLVFPQSAFAENELQFIQSKLTGQTSRRATQQQPARKSGLGSIVTANQLLMLLFVLVPCALIFIPGSPFSIFEAPLSLPFHESFDDNHNRWWVGRKRSFDATVKDGAYEFKVKTDSGFYMFWKDIELKESDDFRMLFKLSKKGPTKQGFYGISWGVENANKHYRLELYDDSCYYFKAFPNGNKVLGQFYLPEESLTGDDKVVTIELDKKADMITFFVNGNVVGAALAKPFFGKGIGFFASAGVTVEVDEISVELQHKPKI